MTSRRSPRETRPGAGPKGGTGRGAKAARQEGATARGATGARQDGVTARGAEAEDTHSDAEIRMLDARARQLRESLLAMREQRATARLDYRLIEIMESLPIPYLVLDQNGIIVGINRSGVGMLGFEHGQIVGRPLMAFLKTSDVRAVMNMLVASPPSGSANFEAHLRTRTGEFKDVRLIMRRDQSPSKGGPCYQAAVVDISQIQRLERDRFRAEKERDRSADAERQAREASEAKDQIIAMVSHELRTPLTPILAAADALVHHSGLAPEVLAKLEIIRRNVKIEARLIDDLLDVARINQRRLSLERRAFDLQALLLEQARSWAAALRERHIGVETDFRAAHHHVHGDEGRLGQVFRNLMSNAAKFTGPGGRIRIATGEYDNKIRVSIGDTGEGMTGEQVAGLFNPFVRALGGGRPSAGLGVGLAISRAIVEAHEGFIEVVSQGPGKGTTVRVDLNLVEAPRAAPTKERAGKAAGAREAPGGVRVLLVEDDHDSAEMLSLLLTLVGHEVKVAHSVQAARGLAGQADVMVSDISLPDGTGLDLMSQLRGNGRQIPAVALSGFGSEQDVQRSLEAGFVEHITKPVDLDRLVEAVARLAQSAEGASVRR
jgi:PAS domain S-box-containing protein